MNEKTSWIPIQKSGNFHHNDIKFAKFRQSSSVHPLLPSESLKSDLKLAAIPEEEKAGVVELEKGELDPLGFFSNGDEVHVEENSNEQHEKNEKNPTKCWLRQWETQKARLAKEHLSSSQTIHITAAIFEQVSDEDASDKNAVVSPHSTGVVEKARIRLEHLEQNYGNNNDQTKHGSTSKKVEITLSEYKNRVMFFKRDLITAWNTNQKVLALRIAIKCFKLLGDLNSGIFYPCIFVLVSDILDCFGNLVFERIKKRALENSNDSNGLPENFTCADISIEAKETCRNWFYKTACIRELLPRIYTEISLLRCYRFLCDGEYPQIISRLSSMIRGIGDPMVALYTRLYLFLMSAEVLPYSDCSTMFSSFCDYLYTFKQIHLPVMQKFLRQQNITESDYLDLHSPAVGCLIQAISESATNDICETMIVHYKEYCNNSMVLYHILKHFPASLYFAESAEPKKTFTSSLLGIVDLIHEAIPSNYAKSELFYSLAVQLSVVATSTFCNSLNKRERMSFLKESWKYVTMEENIQKYMKCCSAFVTLCVTHYSWKQVLFLLQDVIRHSNSLDESTMTCAFFESIAHLIESLVETHAINFTVFCQILISEEFLTILGLLSRQHQQPESITITISSTMTTTKHILRALNANLFASSASSVVHDKLHQNKNFIAVVFDFCGRLHDDSIDHLSSEYEQNEISFLISGFVRFLIVGGKPLKRQEQTELQQEEVLMYSIECRGRFYKLDLIRLQLINHVLNLIMTIHFAVKKGAYKYTQKRHSFIQAALAYCFITIPSCERKIDRIQLSILAAKVGLINQCLPQVDGFLKNAICLLAEVNSTNDEDEIIQNPRFYQQLYIDLLNVLIYVPSNPDQEPFYFVNGVVNSITQIGAKGTKSNSLYVPIQLEIKLQLIPFLCTWDQNKIPNTIFGVDSNDILYGGSQDFKERLYEHLTNIIEDIVIDLSKMEFSVQKNELLLNFVNVLINWVKLTEKSVMFLKNILRNADSKSIYYNNTMSFIERKGIFDSELPLDTQCQAILFQKLAKIVSE